MYGADWLTYGTRRKISLSRVTHCCPNFLNIFCSTSVSILWRICICICIHISDCVEIVYELLLLPNNSASETFAHKSGAVRSVEWVFIIGLPAWRWLDEYVALDKTFNDLLFKHEIVAAPVTYISNLQCVDIFIFSLKFQSFIKCQGQIFVTQRFVATRTEFNSRPWKRQINIEVGLCLSVRAKVWITPQTILWSLPFLIITFPVLWPCFIERQTFARTTNSIAEWTVR
jgi:hypothetical protein